MLLWSRPRRRFGDFAAAGKVTRRPQAAKFPLRGTKPLYAGGIRGSMRGCDSGGKFLTGRPGVPPLRNGMGGAFGRPRPTGVMFHGGQAATWGRPYG